MTLPLRAPMLTLATKAAQAAAAQAATAQVATAATAVAGKAIAATSPVSRSVRYTTRLGTRQVYV
jgi:ABC-type transport system involved in cytochrome c biogenesis permease component